MDAGNLFCMKLLWRCEMKCATRTLGPPGGKGRGDAERVREGDAMRSL